MDSLLKNINFPENFKLGAVPVKKIPSLIWNKVFNDNLINLSSKNFKLLVDPLFDFTFGREINSLTNTWQNTRGFLIQGKLGKRLWFYSGVYENQGVFTPYIDSLIKKYRIVPGQGMYKIYKDKGFDYTMAFGKISYSPSNYFNIQIGHGKNFWGDGYRSLIISDAAFNYPFVKLTSKIWKLKYTNLYAEFQDINHRSTITDGWQKKYGAFHYLSYNISKKIELSIFETIIWQGRDSLNNRNFELNYLNPVIFLRPVEFSVGSPDNALIGVNIRYTIGKNSAFYGQLVLDEFRLSEVKSSNGWWGNKQAFQIGFKSWIPLGKIEESQINTNITYPKSQIFLQTEFNYVRPYMYSHTKPFQNYGHYNQSLAHPLGANFMEWICITRYNFKRFCIEAKYLRAIYGENIDELNYGRNIYLSYNNYVSEYNNYVGQGEKTTLIHSGISLSWLINPANKTNVTFGLYDIIQKSKISTNHNILISMGLRTSMHNIYYDF